MKYTLIATSLPVLLALQAIAGVLTLPAPSLSASPTPTPSTSTLTITLTDPSLPTASSINDIRLGGLPNVIPLEHKEGNVHQGDNVPEDHEVKQHRKKKSQLSKLKSALNSGERIVPVPRWMFMSMLKSMGDLDLDELDL